MQSSPGGDRVAEPQNLRLEIRFPQVLARLMDDRYKRNRAALATAAHVSPSALSQYARGRATPTLAVLVDLAQALDVSLDYLVYGENTLEAVEYTAWAQHLQDTVRVMAAEAASLRQLVNRIGLGLADRIHEIAGTLVRESTATGGAITTAEIAQLEGYAYRTHIATTDLDMDILLPREALPDAVAAPGPFADVVARNVLAGNSYEYVLPDDPESTRRARLIRREVREILRKNLDSKAAVDTAVHGKLNFFAANRGLVPSYVIYELDKERLARERPLLFDVIAAFVGQPTAGAPADERAILAVVRPPSLSFNVYPLIARDNLRDITTSFQELRNTSVRLSFPGQDDFNGE